ncbi:MAG: hypothetical protein IT422_03090 [Pirellulaceae bacterium]|nr:hypothetical protein [Pirellulaceae bacterium]
MSDTLTVSEFEQLSQQVDRIARYHRHQRLLARAKASGDTAAQLEHGLHIADVRIGMAKSPADRDHWTHVHRQLSALVDESGFKWAKGRLCDPAAERSFAKSFAKAAVCRATEFQSLRGEIMQAIAKARSERDSDTLAELYGLRDHLTTQARACGLRLDSAMRFVPARG